MLKPVAFMAVNSLAFSIRPKVISTASRTDMGAIR